MQICLGPRQNIVPGENGGGLGRGVDHNCFLDQVRGLFPTLQRRRVIGTGRVRLRFQSRHGRYFSWLLLFTSCNFEAIPFSTGSGGRSVRRLYHPNQREVFIWVV